MLEALNREILWRKFWEWKLCNVKVTLMLMTWHHEFRYRCDITTVLSFWSLIFRAQLCASTTQQLRFNDAQKWFSFLSFLLSYLCKTLHLWIFFSHLWIFSSSVNFHKRFIFVHPTSFRHSPAPEVNFNYKKNFSSQIQFFFLFSSALTNVQLFRNEKHLERNAIIAFFKKSATVKKKSGDFSRELKTLIFSFHVNDSSFVDDIYYTLMKRRKNDVDAIALRCQISWLIILTEMTLSYVLYDKIFSFCYSDASPSLTLRLYKISYIRMICIEKCLKF